MNGTAVTDLVLIHFVLIHFAQCGPNFYFYKIFSFTAQLFLLPRLPHTKFTPPTVTMIGGQILVDYSVY